MVEPSKRSILDSLPKTRLLAVARDLQLDASSRSRKADLVEQIAGHRGEDLSALLGRLSRDELKIACIEHDLDERGRAKSTLIERLVGASDLQHGSSAATQLELPSSAPMDMQVAPTPSKQFGSFSEITSFLWSVADRLRGNYKQSDYGKVILPFTVLRRLDCVLEPTKAKVLARHDKLKGGSVKNLEPVLNRVTGVPFHNVSKLDFAKLLDDPNHIAANLTKYLKGFSESVREIFIERFDLPTQIAKLDDADLLFQIVKQFAAVDLHPDRVDNHEMGLVYEELIRRFAELSNETAGEHFTPRCCRSRPLMA